MQCSMELLAVITTGLMDCHGPLQDFHSVVLFLASLPLLALGLKLWISVIAEHTG